MPAKAFSSLPAGTLTQFNAILASMQATASLAMETQPGPEAAIVVAMVLHIVAALFLFWSAKPVQGGQIKKRTSTAILHAANHTFRHDQRGWRMTLVALAASCVAAMFFILHAVGFGPSDALI